MSTAPGTTDASTFPLAGIKVLDMTRVLAGVRSTVPSKFGIIADDSQPYCTQILGDLGYGYCLHDISGIR